MSQEEFFNPPVTNNEFEARFCFSREYKPNRVSTRTRSEVLEGYKKAYKRHKGVSFKEFLNRLPTNK